MIFLSIVVPAYNENNRLPKYLKKIDHFCKNFQHACEILIVDDGSLVPIETWLDSAKYTTPIRLMRLDQNSGKGAAVQAGMLRSQGQYVAMVDADGAYTIGYLKRFLKEIDKGADIVIPKRRIDIPQPRTALRALASRCYGMLVRGLLLPGIFDPQCGFKLMEGNLGRSLFAKITEKRWGFDTELLWMALQQNAKIAQVPVRINNDAQGSKVAVLSSALRMFILVIKLKFTPPR